MGALLPIGGIAAVAGSVTYGVLFTLAGRRRPWWMAYVVTLVVWTVIGCLSLVIFNRTEGYVSSDTHVHTFTYSRHGDATIEERMLTLAGEGIELPIATDHNLQIDYEPVARAVGTGAREKRAQVVEDVTATAHARRISHGDSFSLGRRSAGSA